MNDREHMEMTAEEKLEAMMGELKDETEQNISLEPLEKRLSGKENKEFDDPEKEPKDQSKNNGSVDDVVETNPSAVKESKMSDIDLKNKEGEELTDEEQAVVDEANLEESKLKESVSVPSASAVGYILKRVPAINQIIGETFYGSGIPVTFVREGRRFSGIFLFGDTYHLAMEFVIDEAGDTLVSASKFTDPSGQKADWTLDFVSDTFEGCIQELATALGSSDISDKPAIEESAKLNESKKSDVMEFLGTADTSQPISGLLRAYHKWAEENEGSTVSEAYFRNVLKSIGSGTPDVPTGATGGTALKHYQDTFETPVEYDDFEKEIMENDVFYKYEMMGEIVKSIVTKDPLYKNVFIYGVGGIGKTYTVEQVIEKYATPGEVVTYKGAIAGFTGLLQVLWENRDGKILVFDDNDGILAAGNQNAANLLKGAMEMADPRILSYSRFKRKKEGKMSDIDLKNQEGEELTDEEQAVVDASMEESYIHTISLSDAMGTKFFEAEFDEDEFDEDDLATLAQLDKIETGFDKEEFAKTYQGELDADIDPAFGLGPDDEVPDQFQFASRIIFISNLMQVPQPLMDRTHTIGLLLTKEQILDLIDSKVGVLMKNFPQVTLEDKKEVLKFMRTYLHRAGKTPTFRGFQQIVAIYKSDHPNKKKMMYLAYTAGSEMKMAIR